MIRNFLVLPEVQGVNPDSAELLVRHREVLLKKPLMRSVFREFYDKIWQLDHNYFSGNGDRIEVGAGVSIFKKFYPEVMITDIKASPHLDFVLDALETGLPQNSVRALYGINCFHHFPDIERFFREMDRVLLPGGGVILIEPYYGPFASFLFKRLFTTEGFDTQQTSWASSEPDKQGVMTGANQALSYLVFVRDRKLFEQKFPQFEVVEMRKLHSYLRYLLSGGLNFRQLIPSWMEGFVKAAEFVLTPVSHLFALHHVVVIRKRAEEK